MFACSSPSHRLHQVPFWHPERAERIIWAEAACKEAGVPVETPPREVLAEVRFEEALALLHPDGRLERLRAAAVSNPAEIDSHECPVSPGTPEAALDSLRTTLWALGRILEEGGPGICLARPPGHHAGTSHTMGFCYINNIAAAAWEAERRGVGRIGILDIDVHHGNGTQEAFYQHGEIFFCSLHEDPRSQFPGTGYMRETGIGPGLGATLNIPLTTGTGGADYLRILERQALPAVEERRPELILISAGFDTHDADPLGGLHLLAPDFLEMGKLIGKTVDRLKVPALVVLEGGYAPACFMEGLAPMLTGWMEIEGIGTTVDRGTRKRLET